MPSPFLSFKAYQLCSSYASVSIPSASEEETNVKSPFVGENCMVVFLVPATPLESKVLTFKRVVGKACKDTAMKLSLITAQL